MADLMDKFDDYGIPRTRTQYAVECNIVTRKGEPEIAISSKPVTSPAPATLPISPSSPSTSVS